MQSKNVLCVLGFFFETETETVATASLKKLNYAIISYIKLK
jgi:hypothetical protein